MNKLTKNQIIACNIIDDLISIRSRNTQSTADITLKIQSQVEFEEYQKTNDKECLKIMKDWTKQLCEIFKDAQEDWKNDK